MHFYRNIYDNGLGKTLASHTAPFNSEDRQQKQLGYERYRPSIISCQIKCLRAASFSFKQSEAWMFSLNPGL